ncbi:Sodium-independent sulfate anion transporter-like Protein [Tribolium castaneum]|uniref:Sodium-independent sulfate anion transporter-like Protein n=1 Tax=Tribolium castaneum TaxID=7070 RepID=D6WY12_TRICA|nr:PREDICTED: sodium-independent sulfate anion transporter isoform X1 [Tribolium castaneum]EFA07912.1 Sodium-independent sulfate anion transporter-like Protein [Tribolium castaneum]|eukprot:XP_015838437.1 PREDICTED: sodium-independent sulfate anion transporter isoform X1 [Tribolium castaneum]
MPTLRHILLKRLPITTWLPRYKTSTFFRDLLAGFTVSLTEIPQAIAYAVVAGLTPEYGLYAAFMGGFTYALFGSNKDINIGPTSILCLLIQPYVRKFGPDVAVLACFLSGVLIFLLGVLQLGFVIEFFSYPVIAGFTCAASLQIGSTQIKSLLGIPGPADGFLDAWKAVFNNLDQIKMWDTVLGLVSILILVVLKEIQKFGTLKYRSDWSKSRNILGIATFMVSLARNAIIVIIGTVISYNFGKNPPFKTTGEVKAGFPPFGPPPFVPNCNGTWYSFGTVAQNFGPTLIFLPLVAILEAVSIGKAFSKGKALDATQEMLALGLANMAGSFVRSMPITGSFTRTAVNHSAGVKTQFGGVITSVLALLAIAFLTPTFSYVPKASLAAVIICAMFYLFDFGAFVVLWRAKKLDLVPFLTTLFCCLFISLEYGILIGIGVNLLFVLYASARPKLLITHEKVTRGEIFLITPKDTLYFPAAEFLRDVVLACEGENSTVVVNGKELRNVDVTVAKSLAVLVRELVERGQIPILQNFKPSVVQICIRVDKNLQKYFVQSDLSEILKNV